ncbi:coiled-coil domain-containing protein 55 [Coniochaeta sp. 2T2.1]|nr:coiled-coil domain-containing protein 55 [Coniochaeta sp. 2T2.1]
MSKPSKPGLSFGLSMKKGPQKPAPAKRKPATFGNDDDDDDAAPSVFGAAKDKTTAKGKDPLAPALQEVAITELDAFNTTSAPAAPPSPTKKPKSKLMSAPPPPKLSSSAATGPDKAPLTQFGDLSSALSSRKYAEAAADLDPTIYDYDEVYDTLKAADRKKKEAAKAREEEEKNRPRYMASVLSAAAVRERDRLVAEEKRLAREREAEGEEFKDKEKFVTEAYRKQQEEMRRSEEEERIGEEEERKKNKGKGMTGWYKDMLDRGERDHEEVLKAVEEAAQKKKQGGDAAPEGEATDGEKAKTEEDLAKELLQKGKKITINEDGQIVDKRELLQGGLNVNAKKKAEAIREKSKNAAGQGNLSQSKAGVFVGGKQAMRERQTRMLETQLEESLKRAREEEEEEKKKVELVAKSRKTEADISSAKERYLARKRAAEEAKKNGTADAP